MRTYFLGDIHGNVYALEACLKHLHSLKVDEVICLGDLVGWLPFGDRTLHRMRSLNFPTVAGNHDLLVAGLFIDQPKQLDRMQATAFNAGLLSTISWATDFLLNLPLILEKGEFAVTHHSPFHLPPSGEAPTIASFNYLDDTAFRECLSPWQAYPRWLIFSGHDHIPAVYELPDALRNPEPGDVIVHRPPRDSELAVHLSSTSRYWIKAGSVGGPYRDGIPAANSVLYDSEAETVTLFRLPYPTDKLLRELASQRFYSHIPTMKRYLELLEEY